MLFNPQINPLAPVDIMQHRFERDHAALALRLAERNFNGDTLARAQRGLRGQFVVPVDGVQQAVCRGRTRDGPSSLHDCGSRQADARVGLRIEQSGFAAVNGNAYPRSPGAALPNRSPQQIALGPCRRHRRFGKSERRLRFIHAAHAARLGAEHFLGALHCNFCSVNLKLRLL